MVKLLSPVQRAHSRRWKYPAIPQAAWPIRPANYFLQTPLGSLRPVD